MVNERLRLRHVSARPPVLIQGPIVCLCMIVYVCKSEVMACIGRRGARGCPVQPDELVMNVFFLFVLNVRVNID